MLRRSLRKLILMGTATCVLASLIMFSTQSWGDQDSSRLCALQLILNARKLGFKVRNGDFGYLEEGKYKQYRGLLYRGSTYMVIACGDTGVKDLDLYLYKVPSGNLATQDTSSDRTPTLTFTPAKSGTYVLRVKMHSGSGNYTVAVLYK